MDGESLTVRDGTVTLTRATRDDVPAVLALFDGAVAWLVARGITTQWGIEPFSARPSAFAQFEGYAERGVLYVARLGTEVVASIALSADVPAYARVEWEAAGGPAQPFRYVEAFAVARQHAGRGIGAALLSWARRRTTESGATRLWLDCFADNPGLTGYYAGQGFTPAATSSWGRGTGACSWIRSAAGARGKCDRRPSLGRAHPRPAPPDWHAHGMGRALALSLVRRGRTLAGPATSLSSSPGKDSPRQKEKRMGLLDSLLGGDQGNQQRDFINRYEQGHPSEGYSDQEVMDRYSQVAPNLSPDQYQTAAQQAFGRMSPQERMQFGQQLQQYGGQRGMQFGGMPGSDTSYQDPNYLAQMTTQMHQQQPGVLGGLLGGGGGGAGGGLGQMMGNPLAKAALAGIAAMAVKNMMGNR